MTIEAAGFQRTSKGLDALGNNAPRFDASPIFGEVPSTSQITEPGSRHWAGKLAGER